MTERYEPPSDFLKAVIADDVPLVGNDLAGENLRRLIAMTHDEDLANRDWVTLLLAQQEIDTVEIRAALLVAAEGDEGVVRAEAILGLAQRDKAIALPLVRRELAGSSAWMPLFEPAELLADPCLVDDLKDLACPSANDLLDQSVLDALIACKGMGPIDPSDS